jgi:hypothetical protein
MFGHELLDAELSSLLKFAGMFGHDLPCFVIKRAQQPLLTSPLTYFFWPRSNLMVQRAKHRFLSFLNETSSILSLSIPIDFEII